MYLVTYHPKVVHDFRSMHPKRVALIRDIIATKLALRPQHGKPLRHSLKHLRSMRVGDYRIVYAVRERELVILVLTVQNRDGVYREAEKRWKGR